MKWKIRLAFVVILIALAECSDEPVNFALKGVWVDTTSTELQFAEFTSTTAGRFGFLSKNDEHYSSFTYRLLDNQIGIALTGNSTGETLHDLKFVSANAIEIAGLTDLPGDQTKKLKKSKIKRELENKEVILGVDDIYFDKENGLRLQGRCISDSRCPQGVTCFWEGEAIALFNLVVNGGEEFEFELAVHHPVPFDIKNDTLIAGFTYQFLAATPNLIRVGEVQKLEEYLLTVSIEKN